jgi:hypothetical protein
VRVQARKAPVPRAAKAAAKTAKAPVAKGDWKAVSPNGQNGHHALAMAKSGAAEEVIPLNDDEMKDF